MSLYEKILVLYPTLSIDDFSLDTGTIDLQDDGQGAYIAQWNHPTLTRPTGEQLA